MVKYNVSKFNLHVIKLDSQLIFTRENEKSSI